MQRDYNVIYYYSPDDECFLASIPELPGCITDGETVEEAIKNVRDLQKDWIEIAEESGKKIPEPVAVDYPKGEPLHITDIAYYILGVTGDITTKALQKLSYYCQAWSCGWYKKPLFPECFEAWVQGPVNRELYNMHSGLRIAKKYIFGNQKIQVLSEEQKAFVNKVLSVYQWIDPDDLGEITHTEIPWKKARKGIPKNASSDSVISVEEMKNFYGMADVITC